MGKVSSQLVILTNDIPDIDRLKESGQQIMDCLKSFIFLWIFTKLFYTNFLKEYNLNPKPNLRNLYFFYLIEFPIYFPTKSLWFDVIKTNCSSFSKTIMQIGQCLRVIVEPDVNQKENFELKLIIQKPTIQKYFIAYILSLYIVNILVTF